MAANKRAHRRTVSGPIEQPLRSPEGGTKGASHVDRMLGSGRLRAHKRGRDPLHDALYDRLILRKR